MTDITKATSRKEKLALFLQDVLSVFGEEYKFNPSELGYELYNANQDANS